MDGVLNLTEILLVILELKFCGFVYLHNLSAVHVFMSFMYSTNRKF